MSISYVMQYIGHPRPRNLRYKRPLQYMGMWICLGDLSFQFPPLFNKILVRNWCVAASAAPLKSIWSHCTFPEKIFVKWTSDSRLRHPAHPDRFGYKGHSLPGCCLYHWHDAGARGDWPGMPVHPNIQTTACDIKHATRPFPSKWMYPEGNLWWDAANTSNVSNFPSPEPISFQTVKIRRQCFRRNRNMSPCLLWQSDFSAPWNQPDFIFAAKGSLTHNNSSR